MPSLHVGVPKNLNVEGDVLDTMSVQLNSVVYGVGPLILNSIAVDGVKEVIIVGAGSAMQEDAAVMSWLDTSNPNSVLLVSSGSIATSSVEQMKEFANSKFIGKSGSKLSATRNLPDDYSSSQSDSLITVLNY